MEGQATTPKQLSDFCQCEYVQQKWCLTPYMETFISFLPSTLCLVYYLDPDPAGLYIIKRTMSKQWFMSKAVDYVTDDTAWGALSLCTYAMNFIILMFTGVL